MTGRDDVPGPGTATGAAPLVEVPGPPAPGGHGPSLRSVLDHLDEVLVTATADHVLTWVSPSVRAVLGLQPGDLVGSRVTDGIHPDDLARMGTRFTDGLRAGRTMQERFRFRVGDAYRWLEGLATPRRDGHGVLLGWVGSLHDVSERVQQEIEATEATTRLRAIADRTPDLIYALRVEPDRAVEYVSPSCEEMIGVSAAEAVADVGAITRYMHPEDLAELDERINRAWEKREPAVIRWVLPDGRTVWTEHRAGLRYRSDGSLVLEGVGRDVTQQRADREALRSSVETLRLAMEHAPAGMALASADGRFQQVNPALCRFFGRTEQQLLAMNWQGLTDPEDARIEEPLVADLFTGQRDGYRMVKRFRQPDGSIRYGDLSVTAIPGADGRIERILGQILDITEQVTALQTLADSERQYRLLAENGSDIVVRTDTSGRVVWISPAVREVLGYEPSGLIGRPSLDVLHPDEHAIALQRRADTYAGTEAVSSEVRFITADGRTRWMSVRARLLHDEDGRPTGVVSSVRDVDAEVRARVALARSERQFRLAMSVAAAGMAIVDPATLAFLRVNDAMCRFLDRPEEWLLDHAVPDVLAPEEAASAARARQRLIAGISEQETHERRFLRPDGSPRWGLVALAVMRDEAGAPLHFIVHVVDVTDLRETRAELEHRAAHDPLTGFANRDRVRAVLADLLDHPIDGRGTAVLFCDLDNFKVVNDSLGHAAGDEVLSIVATRVKQAVRPGDTVGRVGGDEFAIVLAGVASQAEAEEVAERIRTMVRQELTVEGHRLLPSISIGVIHADATADADAVMRDADTALYRAKAQGRDRWVVFDDEMRRTALTRLTVEAQLRRALDCDEIVAYVQPLVRLSDGSPAGGETLVRWRHPDRGVLTPDAFLDVAEDSGLVVPLGRRMLRLACALVVARPNLGTLSVNVSAVELMQPSWADSVRAALDESGADPRRLILEVTETAILRMSTHTRDELGDLTDLGLRFFVDDFGTGFSSIAHLRDLPVAGVKLDRSFTAGLGAGKGTRLVEGIAGLVTGMGLMGVAEGVETVEQAALLQRMGWEFGQGYLFGRPAPP